MKAVDEITSLRIEVRALRGIKEDLSAANTKLRMENARLKEELHIAEVTQSEFGTGYRLGMTFMQSRILDLLMRHDCVSRALIEHAVYHGRDDISRTSIDVHLKNVRTVLDTIKVTLHNERGHGWRLSPIDKDRIREMTRDKFAGETFECRDSL